MLKQKETDIAHRLESNHPETKRALRYVGILGAIGLIGIGLYAFQSGAFFATFSTGALAALAALMVGALLGFLFGVPRSVQQGSAPISTESSTNGQSNISSTGNKTDARISPNTNLDQISDWLTKIIVGVSLTKITEIQTKLQQIANGIAVAIGSKYPAFSLALILFFLICGFFLSYLWSRIYLGHEFAKADRLIEFLESLQDKLEVVETKADSAVTTAVGEGRKPDHQQRLAGLGSQEADSDDPNKGRFGESPRSNNRELSAEVTPIAGSEDLFHVHLKVRSTDQVNHPLSLVTFFLHPTFNNSSPTVPPGSNGVAELKLTAWGAFTVGAIADLGRTKLELDLADLPDAPKKFRER